MGPRKIPPSALPLRAPFWVANAEHERPGGCMGLVSDTSLRHLQGRSPERPVAKMGGLGGVGATRLTPQRGACEGAILSGKRRGQETWRV